LFVGLCGHIITLPDFTVPQSVWLLQVCFIREILVSGIGLQLIC